MQGPKSDETILQLAGKDTSKCGYCKTGESTSLYLFPNQLGNADYQILMNRGFRRSGKLVYKLLPGRCCMAHTIRLDAFSFQMSKSQKKVLRHLAGYLKKPHPEAASVAESAQSSSNTSSSSLTQEPKDPSPSGNRAAEHRCGQGDSLSTLDTPSATSSSGGDFIEARNNFFTHLMTDPSNKRHFTMTLNPSSLTEEKFQLYKKYQMVVHKDPETKLTPSSFKNFLVDSVLLNESSGSDVGYGTQHMEYRIDGKLVAVSVVDITPNVLSSVYFFYDPDFDFLSLGKISALFDLEWIRSVNKKLPEFRYYYLGYYIATCPKMRYKGEYKPSDLLCSKTYKWVPLEKCRDQVDRDPNLPLCTDPVSPIDPKAVVSRIRFVIRSTPTPLAAFPREVQGRIVDFCKETAEHIGPELASRVWVKL